MNETAPLRVGDMLYGFCGGAFGRDVYHDKRVEAIGADWVVCRTSTGDLAFRGGDPEELREYRLRVCRECDYQGAPDADGACARCGE